MSESIKQMMARNRRNAYRRTMGLPAIQSPHGTLLTADVVKNMCPIAPKRTEKLFEEIGCDEIDPVALFGLPVQDTITPEQADAEAQYFAQ